MGDGKRTILEGHGLSNGTAQDAVAAKCCLTWTCGCARGNALP